MGKAGPKGIGKHQPIKNKGDLVAQAGLPPPCFLLAAVAGIILVAGMTFYDLKLKNLNVEDWCTRESISRR